MGNPTTDLFTFEQEGIIHETNHLEFIRKTGDIDMLTVGCAVGSVAAVPAAIVSGGTAAAAVVAAGCLLGAAADEAICEENYIYEDTWGLSFGWDSWNDHGDQIGLVSATGDIGDSERFDGCPKEEAYDHAYTGADHWFGDHDTPYEGTMPTGKLWAYLDPIATDPIPILIVSSPTDSGESEASLQTGDDGN